MLKTTEGVTILRFTWMGEQLTDWIMTHLLARNFKLIILIFI